MNLLMRLIEGASPATKCPNLELGNCDLLLWGGKNRFVGFVLENELVAIDFKHFFSFRIKIENVRSIPYKLYWCKRRKPPLSLDYAKQYLAASRDNPYAVWNLIVNISSEEDITDKLTEFPPLSPSKDAALQRSAIERMHGVAQPADCVFTFDRTSRIARMIRSADRGMWSHVAMVSNDRSLIEATTDGVVEADFFRLAEPNLDVGLYRPRANLPPELVEKVVALMKSSVGRTKFNWQGVIRIYLEKRWGIRTWRRPNEVTPAEMILGNQFRLICYA